MIQKEILRYNEGRLMMNLLRGRGQQKVQRKNERGATQVLPETVWADDSLAPGIPPEGSVVVTITRQLGSGGVEIGRIVARECGLHYVDHQIIDEVARRLGVQVQQAARQDEYTAGVAGQIFEACSAAVLLLPITPDCLSHRRFQSNLKNSRTYA